MSCCGIRGAVSAESNTPQAIIAATRELLEQVVAANGLQPHEVASAVFTATPDLNAAYPAVAAREMGWVRVPMLCTQEMAVQDSLPRCIRVLVVWNTEKSQDEIHHVYLGAAKILRPDLLEEGRECQK
jgi:chorismate mutase